MSLVALLMALAVMGIAIAVAARLTETTTDLYEFQDVTEVRQQLLDRYATLIKKKAVQKATTSSWWNLPLGRWMQSGSGKPPTNAKQELDVIDADGKVLIPRAGLTFDKAGRATAAKNYAFKVVPLWQPRSDGGYELSVDVQTNPAAFKRVATTKIRSARALNHSQTECHVFQSEKVLGPSVSPAFNLTKPFRHQLADAQLTVSSVSCPANMLPVSVGVEGGCNGTRMHFTVDDRRVSCKQQTGKIPDHPNCTVWTDMGFSILDTYGIGCMVTCCRFGT